ncbi:MAG: alpha/beta hydrolase [Acidimicrobiia bacterium]
MLLTIAMYRMIDVGATHSIAAAVRHTGARIVALTSTVAKLLPQTTELHHVHRSISWWETTAALLERKAAGIESPPSSGYRPEWVQGLPRSPELEPPSKAAAFFARLSLLEAQAFADRFPHRVGSIDGVPPAIRYRANHHLVVRYLDDLRRIRRVLTGAHQGFGWTTDDLSLIRSPIALRSSWSGGEELADLDRRIADAEGWARKGRHFLRFDPSGDGRIVEVLGDLGSSRHVAIIIPGMNNDLSNYEQGLRRSTSNLYRNADGSDAAVIAWLGYDPPDDLLAATNGQPAAAVRSISKLLAGLDVSIDHDLHVSLIGHSYGSVVLGAALRAGVSAEEVVFIGSPGVGVDHASDLGLSPPTRIWAGRAAHDPIQLARSVECLDLVPVCFPSTDRLFFGTDPTDPTFGATVFRVEDGSFLAAHSSYFRPGSAALNNLTAIFLGRDNRVIQSSSGNGPVSE